VINSYSPLCDGFCLDMSIGTELDLPSERDTVLTFFERIKKQFPAMGNFHRRDNGDFSLSEDRHGERYRWVALEIDRICSACADPTDLDDAYNLHSLVLEIAPYMLGLSPLDVSWLDIIFTMDFDYKGNHNEVIADVFFNSTAFNSIIDLPGAKAMGCSPTLLVALSDDCRLQARIGIASRTTVYDVRNQNYKADEPISLYCTIRRYPDPDTNFDIAGSFGEQSRIAHQLMDERIIPNFVKPLTNAIAQRR